MRKESLHTLLTMQSLFKEPFTNDVIVLRGRGSPNYDGGREGEFGFR